MAKIILTKQQRLEKRLADQESYYRHKEEIAARRKEKYWANVEERRKQARESKARCRKHDPEKIRRRGKAWRDKNKEWYNEKIRAKKPWRKYTEEMKVYRKMNRKKLNAKAAAWAAANRPKVNAGATRRRLRKLEEKMGRPRSPVCEITGKKIITVYDHHHPTNSPRGWIWDRCNRIAAMARDDSNLLRLVADYLDAHRDKLIKEGVNFGSAYHY